MQRTRDEFREEYKKALESTYAKPVESCTDWEKYETLVRLVKNDATSTLKENRQAANASHQKRVYYFSMEFLIGKLLENYLINIKCRDMVSDALSDLGIDLEKLFEIEPDPGLGNGGLGRLAACFLDSMASLGINGDGVGLRYRFGLFRQKIKDGKQVEEPDAWLENGYPWEVCKPDEAVIVKFGGHVERTYENGEMHFEHRGYTPVLATPYDVPILGYDGVQVNTLRLYSASLVKEKVDMKAFNLGEYGEAFKEQSEVNAITTILYPDDSNGSGKILRLKQEYLMVAAGLASILEDYERTYGPDAYKELGKHISIHTNDTHPALCVPELLRILIDDKGLSWDDAWNAVKETMSFTNHTVLPEALEKWPIELMQQLLPRVYQIIEEIDRRFRETMEKLGPDSYNTLSRTAILWDGEVRMANLSIIGSHSVNGVAALHSKILVEDVFKEFYALDPQRFNNKTNGVTHRRFLIQADRALTGLLNEYIGKDWLKDMTSIENVLKFKDNEEFLMKLRDAKHTNKLRLAEYIRRNNGIEVDTDSLFDIQVKRIHAYKRQLLNAFKVLNLYNEIKENPDLDIYPTTFIFAGKAAQGYVFAKEVIEFINTLAKLVNEDPVVSRKIKVVFVENFCVSNAGYIYPAADISEQISTAGKEASGTGNMKFMMNGALTLGTLDGANVEILEQVGDENIKIFGLNADETMNYYVNGGYNAKSVADADPRLKRIMEQIISGELPDGKTFFGIYDDLITHNDEYFVLADFDAYIRAWKELNNLYRDINAWGRKSLINIGKSAFFSSDRTIREYAHEIWDVPTL